MSTLEAWEESAEVLGDRRRSQKLQAEYVKERRIEQVMHRVSKDILPLNTRRCSRTKHRKPFMRG